MARETREGRCQEGRLGVSRKELGLRADLVPVAAPIFELGNVIAQSRDQTLPLKLRGRPFAEFHALFRVLPHSTSIHCSIVRQRSFLSCILQLLN